MCALFYIFLIKLSLEKITECKYPCYIKLAICHLWLLRCWPVYLTRLDFGLGILLALMLLPNGFCGQVLTLRTPPKHPRCFLWFVGGKKVLSQPQSVFVHMPQALAHVLQETHSQTPLNRHSTKDLRLPTPDPHAHFL